VIDFDERSQDASFMENLRFQSNVCVNQSAQTRRSGV